LARAARSRGNEALRANEHGLAIRWFERAHRLLPADPLIAATLATSLLGYEDLRAQALFREIATNSDLRDAWIGLSTACLRLGDRVGAASAMARALRGHALPKSASIAEEPLLRDLARGGWCGLLGSGRLVIGTAGDVEISVDGRRIRRNPVRVNWAKAREISVTADGRHLLGSPIDVVAVARTVGYVEKSGAGIRGWAVHPKDTGTKPRLSLLDGNGCLVGRIVCSGRDVAIRGAPGGMAPWGFSLDAARLGGVVNPLRIVGRDGSDLWGSPVSLATATPAFPEPSAKPPSGPRAIAVVIPVVRDWSSALDYAERVAAGTGTAVRVIVSVTDLGIATGIVPAGRAELVRYEGPEGFGAAANAGISASGDCDAVLLRPGVSVPPGWLECLAAAAHAAPDIGTVMPFIEASGDGTHPDMRDRLGRLAGSESAIGVVDVPYGEGHCLYIKRACLDEVGSFDVASFAQDYGADTDFCMRARRFGWRHVAVPNLVVVRHGDTDRGLAAEHLRRRNLGVLRRRYTDFRELDDAFSSDAGLGEARRRIETARWHAASMAGERSIILVAHADGGGVAQRVGVAARKYRDEGFRPVVLSPLALPGGVKAASVDGYPHLRFALPDEMQPLTSFLRGTRPSLVEVHHTLGHDSSIYEAVRCLTVPYDVHIHDYAWVCPRIALLNRESRYCGEPDLAGCEACVLANGNLIGEDITVSALRRRSAAFLGGARQVIAPSPDTAVRMRRYFPSLPVSVVPHGVDAGFVAMPAGRGMRRICVLGGIGPHKGFDVLLACARDAAARDLALEFVVVGDTSNDLELLATGHAMITGTYAPTEAVNLVRAQNATLGFLPSVWPETWSLTLTELWEAGLPVAAFDLGAPADRIRATGWGFLFPLGLPPGPINDAFLAVRGRLDWP